MVEKIKEYKEKKLIKLIHKDIDRKFDKVILINVQNFSINGIATYNNEKCFFKIVDKEYFIKEINGYLISYKKIPIMEIIFTKYLFNVKKYLIAYKYDNNIKKSNGLLNDIFVKNDFIKYFPNGVINKLNNLLKIYDEIYSSKKEYFSYCPSNIFFIERVYSRLKKWYFDSNEFKKMVLIYDNKKLKIDSILKETFNYFINNKNKKMECVLLQGDPNTLNISLKPCFFDLASAGYNPIVGELAITIISTLIYDNYFCPKYHPKSYRLHENAIHQFKYFKPNLSMTKNKKEIYVKSNIVTSNIRKKYILDYLKILEKNNIKINEEIKYYIIMRLTCVFDIRKMEKIDYYYSLYMICYFYKNINENVYKSMIKIINEMDVV